MNINNKKIILGSASPRRKELLGGLDIEFEVDVQNNFEEVFNDDVPHDKVPSLMSEGKSFGFHRALEQDEILITSDTMVLCDDNILGKPKSKDDAINMLKMLSNNKHKVITAVTIRDKDRCQTFSDTATVYFTELSDWEIEYYLERYKPYDKAGSYGIQEWIGYIGIDKIEGSFYTIMGFPIHQVYKKIKEFTE